MATIAVQGQDIPMMEDGGASLTVISTKLWKQLGQPPLQERKSAIQTYDDHQIDFQGDLITKITFIGKTFGAKIVVVKCKKTFGLLGRDILPGPETCNNASSSKKLSMVSGAKASIKLKTDANPMFCAARKVPLPLENKVNSTIDELVNLGILEPTKPGGTTNESTVVWVKKGDKLRVSADFKIHVNDKINTEAYPLPCIETIFSRVSGAKPFGKIDLSNAYWQIPIDEDSQEVCTVNTTKGLFRVTRLQQGLKNAAAVFPQVIEQVFKGLDGHIGYQDDILIFGRTKAKLKKRYNVVKERLQGRNFTLNEDKCVSFSSSLSFLGHEISAEGIKLDPKHVQKLLQLQPPTNVKEVESFIGLVNYFARMIPDYAAKNPMHQ